jgi:demethylmenaquinone methyltransferase/2-methoxy-6-polyprenyl-1,4-benzoquinol methylase
MDIGDYARHARIWDWGGFDDTAEYEYWRRYAAAYGRRVLLPMCALGQTGAYLAERGFDVTAYDITPEMIAEGRRRFGHLPGLHLLVGDVRSFRCDPPAADFCCVKDFGHLHTPVDVRAALASIAGCLRPGGALVIEAGLPVEHSSYTPPETFYPLRQVYPGLKVWKVGETRHEADTGRTYIAQTVYIEHECGALETFEHAFYLQSYTHDAWLDTLRGCGFEVRHEYRNRDQEPWRPGDGLLLVEAVKSATPCP